MFPKKKKMTMIKMTLPLLQDGDDDDDDEKKKKKVEEEWIQWMIFSSKLLFGDNERKKHPS